MLRSASTVIPMLLMCGAATTSCTHQLERGAQAVPVVHTRRVENAVDAGDGDIDMRAFRKRLAADARDLDARMSLAALYARRGFTDVALEHYRLAALQFPDSPAVTLALAKMLRQVGEPGAAVEAVRAALERHPGGTWELLSLEGILEDGRGRFAAAESAHRAALALNPARGGLHNNLGYNLLLQGKPEAAADEFRRAIQIDPRSEIAHNNLGAALASQSQAREALSEWRRSGNPAAAHNNLAAVLMEQGRYADARSELAAALALRRNYPAALANLRLLAEKDGRPAVVRAQRPPPKKGKAAGAAARAASAPSGAAVGN